jgi:hypothetical protein
MFCRYQRCQFPALSPPSSSSAGREGSNAKRILISDRPPEPGRSFCGGQVVLDQGGEPRGVLLGELAAAALHGGAEPGLPGEAAWWLADDFWQYALLAAVAYLRAAVGRAGVPVCQVCQELPRS